MYMYVVQSNVHSRCKHLATALPSKIYLINMGFSHPDYWFWWAQFDNYNNVQVYWGRNTTISAYSGCLVASLTLPTRPPFIDTFKQLLDQEDVTIVGSAHNSFMAYLSQTKDSVMMVQISDMLLVYMLLQL